MLRCINRCPAGLLSFHSEVRICCTALQPFKVGADVVAKPSKKGKVGNPTGPKRMAACVVGVSKPFGQLKYKLRSNTGWACWACWACWATPTSTASCGRQCPAGLMLHALRGAGVQAVPQTTGREARGGAMGCRCRAKGGKCGKACPCKKGGNLCGRHCSCKHGKGGTCGNCKSK